MLKTSRTPHCREWRSQLLHGHFWRHFSNPESFSIFITTTSLRNINSWLFYCFVLLKTWTNKIRKWKIRNVPGCRIISLNFLGNKKKKQKKNKKNRGRRRYYADSIIVRRPSLSSNNPPSTSLVIDIQTDPTLRWTWDAFLCLIEKVRGAINRQSRNSLSLTHTSSVIRWLV